MRGLLFLLKIVLFFNFFLFLMVFVVIIGLFFFVLLIKGNGWWDVFVINLVWNVFLWVKFLLVVLINFLFF